jgi:hypothetical protein
MTGSSVLRRGLLTKALALAAFLALATLGLVGCGGSSAPAGSVADEPSLTRPRSDEAAFRAFQDAIRAWENEWWVAQRGKPIPDRDDCGVQPPPSLESSGKVAVIEVMFDSLLRSQNGVPAYEKLAQTLAAIPTENEALKKVAAGVNQMARDLAPALKKADIDLCAELELWEAANWSDSYYRELNGQDPFSTYGLDRAKYFEAQEQIRSAGPDLEKIPGASPDEALSLRTAWLF